MDDVIEIVLEIVLDGMVEAAGSKRVPLPLRIILGGIPLLLAVGVIALLFWVGVRMESVPLIVTAAAVTVIFGVCAAIKVRRHIRRG